MSTQQHWEHIYRSKTPAETSWFRPHLEHSLAWILKAAPDRAMPIIDVGAGESTLVDDLLAEGYRDITALDISEAALTKVQMRLGPAAKDVRFIVGDVTEVALASGYGVWHDRAVFHFLTAPEQRAAYVRQLLGALRHGGHVVIATFGPQGPQKCSGLPTMRYDAQSLRRELGSEFRLADAALIEHETPFGTSQQFLYCDFIRD